MWSRLAVGAMHVDLRVHGVGEQSLFAVNQRNARFIARAFNAENFHGRKNQKLKSAAILTGTTKLGLAIDKATIKHVHFNQRRGGGGGGGGRCIGGGGPHMNGPQSIMRSL